MKPPPPLPVRVRRERNPLRRALMILGPGLVTGASDDDPSGIATYAVAGASYGFATLWTAIISLPLMASVQFMSAKIGMVTGTGLAGVVRKRYSRKLLYPVLLSLLVMNTINAGTDIGAIAAAINLIVPVSIRLMIVPVALGILVLQIWGSYDLIARTFKWLSLALLAYIATAFFTHPGFVNVAKGTFVPTLKLDAAFIATLIALFGTTISPYLWFWQSSQEVEEEISQGRTRLRQRQGATDRELKYKAWDVNSGMVLSEVVAYFIILTTAATLFKAGETNVNTAADAASALRPLAGDAAKYLLAVGLIGAGVLAVPVLTGASALALSEGFNWKASLNDRPHKAKRFYFVIAASTLVGLVMNYVGISPITALFYTAILNGLLAPLLLVVIMLLSSDRTVLGDRVNNRTTNILGWATTVVMSLAAVAYLVLLATGNS